MAAADRSGSNSSGTLSSALPRPPAACAAAYSCNPAPRRVGLRCPRQRISCRQRRPRLGKRSCPASPLPVGAHQLHLPPNAPPPGKALQQAGNRFMASQPGDIRRDRAFLVLRRHVRRPRRTSNLPQPRSPFQPPDAAAYRNHGFACPGFRKAPEPHRPSRRFPKARRHAARNCRDAPNGSRSIWLGAAIPVAGANRPVLLQRSQSGDPGELQAAFRKRVHAV